MKHKKTYEIVLLVATVIILYFVLKDNFESTLTIVKNANYFYLFLAALLYSISFLLEALTTFFLIKEYKANYTYIMCVRLALVTKFFNGITPLATGGRPLLVFELKKDGIPAANGTNVVVQNFMLFQVSLIIFSIITFMLDSMFNLINVPHVLSTIMYIGFALNSIILIIAFIFSIKKNINNSIITFFINFLAKIKIIKKREERIEQTKRICAEYYNAFKDFKHKTKLIVKSIVVELLSLVAVYSVIILIFKSLDASININYISSVIASNYIFLAGSYIPMPGGIGGMEFAFIGYCKIFASKLLISPALILWRFITYYAPTLVGGILFNIKTNKN